MYVVVFVGIGMAMVYILFELIHRLRNIKILISEFHLGPFFPETFHYFILFPFFMRCINLLYIHILYGG